MLSLVLTNLALDRMRGLYRAARHERGMGVIGAVVSSALVRVAYALLRLEAPAWQALRMRWRPWFAHLSEREYRTCDPIRYALQALWLLLVVPPRARSNVVTKKARSTYQMIRRHRWSPSAKLADMVTRSRIRTVLASPALTPLRHLSTAGRKLIFIGLGVVTILLSALLVTQPFNLLAQFIFILLLWGTALVVRRVPGRYSTLVLIVLSLVVSCRYLWWRYTDTLHWDNTLDLTFGIMLLLAETYSWIILLMGYVQIAWPLDREVATLPADRALWPIVDLMIPTYNEDLSIVKPTVYAALGMDWPQDKLRIHLLDDGRRPEFRDFAAQAGIHYIIRPDGRHAKAGNLNHAMAHTDAELIAIFDCDHIPTRSFLQLTVGWFLRDPKLALVQAPHHFFSPDPFERNLGHFGTQPNENALFNGLVQAGNDLWNAAFFCGSCAVLRRTALDSVGGFAVETVTEDAHTALRLHRHGYNSAYIRIPMAAGLATDSLSAHIGQRIRWARGMVQIFRTDNPLLGKGLSIFQRLCYVNAMLHFLSGIPRLIYLLAPLAFLLAHSYIIYAPALAIILYVFPHMLHAGITNTHMQGSYRNTFWGEIYETALSWYIARPTTIALFAPTKGTFNVTGKGGLVQDEYYDWNISSPYVLLASANFIGLGFGVWRIFTGPTYEVATVLITMLWAIYNLIILGGALAVAAETRQIRNTHRVTTSLPASLKLRGGQTYPCVLADFSEGGVGLTLLTPQSLSLNDPVRIVLARGDRQFSFPARVSRNLDLSLGVKFDPLSRQQHIDLVQCTFARADSWLAWRDRFVPNRAMGGVVDIVMLGIDGYARLADHMPFPLNVLLRQFTNLVVWILSFLPRTQPQVSSDKLSMAHYVQKFG